MISLVKSLTFVKTLRDTRSEVLSIDENLEPFYLKWIEPSLYLSPGALHIHNKLEKVVCTTVSVAKLDHISKSFEFVTFIPNPLYHKKSHSITRTCMVSTIISVFVFSILRLGWIKAHWKESSLIEQLFLYMVIICMLCIGLGAWTNLHKHANNYCFLINQRLKFAPVKYTLKYSTQKTLGDLFMYSFGLCCAAFPIMVMAIPLTLDYDPISLMINCFTEIESISWEQRIGKGISFGFVYAVLVTYFAGQALSLILIVLIFTEGLQTLSNNLYPRESKKRIRYSSAYKSFRICQLLLSEFNNTASNFLFILMLFGILFGGSCAYATLMLYNDLPLLTYLACPVIVIVALTVDFVLIAFAYIPNKNACNFKLYWERRLKLLVDKKRLISCPKLGYDIGPMKNVHLFTSLMIANGIINCTVNFTLLDGLAK